MAAERLAPFQVLVVEDDALLCDLVVEALARLGQSVLGSARDSVSALGLVGPEPTVALVDYLLLDGQCDGLLGALQLAGVPVALMTAFAPHELPPEWLRYPILFKPFGLKQLETIVDQLARQLNEQPGPLSNFRRPPDALPDLL